MDTLTVSDTDTEAPPKRRGWSEARIWGTLFMVPYVLVFLFFVVYPVCYGFWLARDPQTYVQLFEDPIFIRSIFNTLFFLLVGVNLKMLVALLLSGLAQVPGELTEAARADGGTRAEVMRRVVLPNMKAAIMVAVLFRALDAFRIFDNIQIMTAGARDTASLSVLAYNATINRVEIGMGSALSVILLLCFFLIALLFIRGFKVDLAGGRG